ncbi:MAG: hemerythrin family protein [bacterium]|nr:hemerythrin family protein [bacterium]
MNFSKKEIIILLITWDDSIALNINEIDNQHKKLVNIINELYEAMKKDRGNDIIDAVLKKLVDYTDCHFATEERYFDLYRYSESEHHKEEHRYFVEQVNEFNKAFAERKIKRDGSDSVLTFDLWRLLKSWLINHIQISDKKYASLFKENGVK